MSAIASLAVALSTTWTVLGSLAVLRVTQRSTGAPLGHDLPAVSVLKPLCGADPGLRENLESFFRQDHRGLQLVFGVQREDDPALRVVRRLIELHPHVDARIAVHQETRGLNPKVRNLLGMLPAARHDLVLISDSNVRAPRHYVRELAAIKHSDPSIGLVTNLFAGEGTGGLGSELESVQLSGFVAAGAALPTLVGDAAVIGKSMLFSRSELQQLGGLESVSGVLAEDYLIGKKFESEGRKIVVAPTTLTNVVGEIDVKTVFDRHLRWSMMRHRLRPFFFYLEPLTVPLFMLPAALLALGKWALPWLCAMWLVRDLGGWLMLHGRRGAVAPLALSPLRDAVALAVWAVTPFKRHVAWRGHRARLGKGTVLTLAPERARVSVA